MHLITVWIPVVAVCNAEKEVNITKVLTKKDTSSNISQTLWSYYLYSPNAYMSYKWTSANTGTKTKL